MTAMIATLLALTLPQRKAMGAHLVAYASQWEVGYGPISLLQAQEIATQILEPTRDQIDRNLAVLKAAVFLNPARGLISSRDLATLTRAWIKLGWSWEWPGQGGETEACKALITQAASGIRNIMNPVPPPAPPEFPTRCGNGRKCRHHATGADRKWSCGPDAYEPSHGSDDPRVVGEQEAAVPHPEQGSEWIREDGSTFRIVDTGGGWKIRFAGISDPAERGLYSTDTWTQGIRAGAFRPYDPTVPAPPPEAEGDVQCTECGQYYWSGQGHPTIALCPVCWKPRGCGARDPDPVSSGTPTPTTPHDRSGEPDLDFTSAPLPKGYTPPPSSGERFPAPVAHGTYESGGSFPNDPGPWEG